MPLSDKVRSGVVVALLSLSLCTVMGVGVALDYHYAHDKLTVEKALYILREHKDQGLRNAAFVVLQKTFLDAIEQLSADPDLQAQAVLEHWRALVK